MRCVIVTGMSGAGKSTALNVLEDVGYYCVDNIPISLIDKFAELAASGETQIERIALGIDIRSGKHLPELPPILENLREQQFPFEILFLDADDATLVKRFAETRRHHPLAREARIEDGVREERARLDFLREAADCVIDTSDLLTRDLQARLEDLFATDAQRTLKVTVLSFGFKFGIPQDADLVFDARFLPNPYYVEQLRRQRGIDPDVKAYVMDSPGAAEFLTHMRSLLGFLVPQYLAEGRHRLVIAVGCTGGRHRSVTLAGEIGKLLEELPTCRVRVAHRDMENDNVRKQYDANER